MDRTAIVTGGTGGLGRAVVERLVADGWRAVVPWVLAGDDRAFGDDPAGIELVEADLFEPEAVGRVVGAASGAPGAPLRAVVNLVGGFAQGGRIHETPIEEFEAQFRLNLRPAYLMTAAAAPHLIEVGGGSVVCVSTRAAL
jgi:NAD(P)-dependent dehydrogenase (short-subunit alcohol dehydrogenase family)